MQSFACRLRMQRAPLIVLTCFSLFALGFHTLPAAAQTALPIVTAEPLTAAQPSRTWTLDLGTLPNRPALVGWITPPPSHPDLIAEIVFENYAVHEGLLTCGWESDPGYSVGSGAGSGERRVEEPFFQCDPRTGLFVGDSLDVTVRVLDFGAAGAPVDLAVVVRGETRVPFGDVGLAFTPTTDPQTVRIPASKDTTIYEDSVAGSNGAGSVLWSGYELTFEPPFTFIIDERRAFVAFDFAGPVPNGATVTDAALEMSVANVVNNGGDVSLFRVAASPNGAAETWAEGDAVALGSEFQAGFASGTAATWLTRSDSGEPWIQPGGDVDGSALDTRMITSLGTATFSSPALTSAVVDMVSTGEDQDGFGFRGPLSISDEQAVGFRSREGSETSGPEMLVTFVPTTPLLSGIEPGEQLESGTFNFVGEGEDFRWIYDTDDDDVLATQIGGICTVLPDVQNPNAAELPYTYQYTGSPSFVGLDCCTWQIESPLSGTLGTGQAIFFHNLDPADPANLPPDTDGDGIRDLCDNCPTIANGPFLGTCLAGADDGLPCRSDAECGGGGLCSLSQEDSDFDETGDVCVPEPGFGMGLALGAAGLLGRRRFGTERAA